MIQNALQRTKFPIAVLIILLQRMPLWQSHLLPRLSAPAIQILQKTVITAAALGAPHSLSGQSQSKYSVDRSSNSNQVGEAMWITFSINITPESWEIEGQMPPGLYATDLSNQLRVQSGLLAADFGIITGIPSQEGVYKLTLTPWEFINGTGETAPDPPGKLQITINVAPGEVDPPEKPIITFSIQGEVLTLSWKHTAQFPYSVERSNDLNLWLPSPSEPTINGETATLSFSQDENLYAFYRLVESPVSQ